MKIGIIVQARFQSTRLPGKILLDFYKGKTILEVLIENLSKNVDIPIVVATSTESADDKIVELCERNIYSYFRGSENDVLSRFIGAAKEYTFTHVIRVCSDNPFMLPDGVQQLVDEAQKNPNLDYISFKVSGSPSILTHYGLWAELAKVSALEIAFQQENKFYHEHVTNFLYAKAENFKLKWLDVSTEISQMNQFRLTVDEAEDFRNAQKVITTIDGVVSIDMIMDVILNDSDMHKSMQQLINKHTKA